jgi:uncharacterized protein YbaP (TraB family)
MKKGIFVLAALLFCVSAIAQSSIWKISKGKNALYLGGSLHALRANDFPLPKEFDSAFERSAFLVLEANLEEMSDPGFLQKISFRIMLPQGKTLKTELSPPVYERLASKCAELGIPMDSVSQFTPFMAMLTLTALQLQKLGFMPQGVDSHYLSRAKQEGKKLAFLESAEYQISLMDDEESLLQSLDDLDQNKLKTVMPAIIAEWRKGQTAQTEKIIAQMKVEVPGFHKRIFTDRNKAWLGKIEQYLDTRETEFIVVGLGHLAGNEGLLKLLRDRGYKVEQLR